MRKGKAVLALGLSLGLVFSMAGSIAAYERYEKAIKLINRLNSSFIKYDDIEVINYRDIISYDNNSNKYIYSGISFSSNDIDSFNEYRVKYSIFDKIKKEIIIKIKSMKLCNNIND